MEMNPTVTEEVQTDYNKMKFFSKNTNREFDML